jgi:DNA repair photolyase
MEIRTIQTKSILTPSKLPDCDYVVNPYIGCSFACKYCYASFMGRFVDKDIKDWGKYVFVKTNASKLLKSEIEKLKNNGKDKVIFFSSVTDPYQSLEAKYKLTRTCLEIILKSNFLGTVSILTKSDLILRDIDLLKKVKKLDVGLTITSTQDKISRYFETLAPPVENRIKALKNLNQNSISTYAFIGPLFPHLLENPQLLEDIFKQVAETGTKKVYVEHLNLKKYIRQRLFAEMKDFDQALLKKYYLGKNQNIIDELNQLVLKNLKKYNLSLLTGKIISH